jgi:hypothetical protein
MLPVDAEEDLGKAEIEFAASVAAPSVGCFAIARARELKAVPYFFSIPERQSLQ